MQTYAEAFERLPAAARTGARRAALDRLLSLGLPTSAEEDWKYLDLSPLLALAPGDTAIDAAAEAAPLADNADGLDALNAAFASGGLNLDLPANSQSTEVIRDSGRGHRRHRLRLGRHAQALLCLELDPTADFQTQFLDLELEAGASLQLLRLQDVAAGAHRITRIRARLGRDARLDLSHLDLGGRLCRHDVQVELAEPGAEIHIRGLFLGDGEGVVDNHVRVDHRAEHGTSRLLARGLARDRARGVCNGKIVVHEGAQKTDSEQRVANLILSPKAEINAKPELEIYADDVKCAHGATFGQLDPAALFYLRSRGLPVEQAHALLTLAFAIEPLRQIPHLAFREDCIRRVADKLGAELLAEDLT